jgi:two-component system LytT family response regulator
LKSYKVIIVDDEPDSRELLSSLLVEFPDIELVGQAGSVTEAIALILKTLPDLIFLDIQMPMKNGFELIAELRDLKIDIPVVFVTAYDQFAIKAIKTAALDYLLKPIDPVELAKAIGRFRQFELKEEYRRKFEDLIETVTHDHPSGKLRFNNRKGYILVDPADILYMEAEGNYTQLHLRDDKKEIISNNLGALEKMLPGKDFLRISRSLVINSMWLNKVDRLSHHCILHCDGNIYKLKFSGNDIYK